MDDPFAPLLHDLTDYRSYVRDTAAVRLAQIGGPAVAPLLTVFPHNAAWVLMILANIDADPAIDALLALLSHPERSIRMKAAKLLKEKPIPRAQAAAGQFFHAMLHSPVAADRYDAVLQIANSHLPQADAAVRQALQDPDPQVRDMAAANLEQRRTGVYPLRRRLWADRLDPATVARILAELDANPHRSERHCEALAQCDDPRAIDALLTLLARTTPNSDRDLVVRVKAVRTLGRIGDARVIPVLEELVRTDTSSAAPWGEGATISVAEVAHDALEELRWRLAH